MADASETDRALATEIARLLGGLPLALDQAGAYIEETACTLSDYLARYQTRHPALLRRRGPVAFEHPEPVTTTWSHAFGRAEQANPTAADLLRLCAFLPPEAIPEQIVTRGAADLGPLLRLAADPLLLDEAIGELLKDSLVRRRAEARLLSIHPLVQVVLRDGMDAATRRLWAERAARAIAGAGPEVAVKAWPRCRLHLPHEEAAPQFRHALAIGAYSHDPTHPKLGATAAESADLLHTMGRETEAGVSQERVCVESEGNPDDA